MADTRAATADIELFSYIERELYTAVFADSLDELGHHECAMNERLRPISSLDHMVGWAKTISARDVHYELPDPHGKEIEAVDLSKRMDAMSRQSATMLFEEGYMAASKTPSAPSLDRALSILELVASSKAGLTMTELVRRLGLPKSSVHCLLVTLERRGYLVRNPRTGRLMFGLRLFDVANMALATIRLRDQVAPFLQALADQTRLIVHMGILEQGEILLVEKLGLPGLARSVPTWVGKRLDLHCTGMGKALIAYLPDAEFDRLFRGHPLPRYNENTITSFRKLKEHAVQIRRLGYAFEDEEGEIGFRCIGAPVFDQDGKVVAAISVAGSTAQIAADSISPLVEAVKHTAGCISRSLGFQQSLAPPLPDNCSGAGMARPV